MAGDVEAAALETVVDAAADLTERGEGKVEDRAKEGEVQEREVMVEVMVEVMEFLGVVILGEEEMDYLVMVARGGMAMLAQEGWVEGKAKKEDQVAGGEGG